MAVSIDNVYQKVLAFANKEQRGYITPQEFNLFAHQAQMEIFEQYFYDTNQFKRIPGNDSEYHDMVDLIDEKLYVFKKNIAVTNGQLVNEFYRLGDVYVLESGYSPANASPFSKSVCVEEIKQEDLIKTQNSPLTRATNNRPIYYVQNGAMLFFPETAPNGGNYRAFYIDRPTTPSWGYVVVNDKALYNSTSSTDFQLHLSEESELVYRILAYAGISIQKPELTQMAMSLEGGKVQQEKQ